MPGSSRGVSPLGLLLTGEELFDLSDILVLKHPHVACVRRYFAKMVFKWVRLVLGDKHDDKDGRGFEWLKNEFFGAPP